jgi:hypothetical protein
MRKTIMISTDGPEMTRVSIPVQLQGGSPWFGYIWIDDVCYTITKKERSVTIRKTTLGGKG